MATTASQLSSVAPVLLPATIADPIFTKAVETSAVMQLARKVPLAVNAQTAIPVPMDIPQADWVAEGGAKPTGSTGMGAKIMTGKKVALLLPVSQEVAMTNSAGLYAQISQDAPTAIARAFDYAAIHGKAIKGGGAGPFANYLAQTPYSVNLGTAAASAGGMYTDLWTGVSDVVNNYVPYEFSGFAADPRLRPELAQSVDVNGRSFFLDNSYANGNSGVNTSSLIGYPAYFNSGVSGKYYRDGDAVQVVTINGTPTGGTFTVTVGGSTTSAVAYSASAATLQAAIRAINVPAPFGFGGNAGLNVTVTGSAGGPYTLTFLAGQASGPVSVDQTLLTGNTAATSQATITRSPDTDSGLRAIGGDFSQCAYGVGMDISIKVSTEASYVDAQGATHSAFQENLLLLLVEAYFGFVVNDVNAFVAYTS
jgi:hypothetical protein